MTTRDARKAGASYGVSQARAEHAGDRTTARAYAERCEREAIERVPTEQVAAYWDAYHAAYDTEWARLEEES